MKNIILLAISILILPHIAVCNDIRIPDGWRAPDGKEVVEIWGPNGMKVYHVVREDFNNDGVVDEARLLRKKNGKELGFFIFMSESGEHKTYQLEEWGESKWLNRLGVALVKPGRYATAYGKGYSGDYGPNEPKEIVLEYPGINLFLSESANSYYYYSSATKSIKRTWISD